ncbi:MAG: hypothetical protein GF330_02500 [Candidatus Eisenbacteria bacterium]|nr:hypothetical protein [Candidatus Eisenbacteria bacterium]
MPGAEWGGWAHTARMGRVRSVWTVLCTTVSRILGPQSTVEGDTGGAIQSSLANNRPPLADGGRAPGSRPARGASKMPLFEVMRENTKVILWITVVAFVGLIFLAWGADFTSRLTGGSVDPGVLAKVNGDPITARQYSEALRQAQLVYEQQTGRRPDEQTELMLRSSTWEQLVDRTLMEQAIERHGVVVSDQEVAQALLTNPPQRFLTSPSFQTDGQFDMRLYQSWLSDPRTNTLPLEREQREMLEQAKLQMLLLTGVKVSEAEVREAWLAQGAKRDLAYVQIPYRSLPDPPAPTDAQLQQYLADHQDEYALSSKAALQYVRWEKGVSSEDSLDAASEIRDALEELERGEPFEVIVQIYSEAPPSRRGGESGTRMRREQFSRPAVRDAAFSLEVGSRSDVITTEDGFHIIEVQERTGEGEEQQVKIAEIFVPLRMSYETNFALRDRAMEFADSAAVMGFGEAAEVFDLQVAETGEFDPEGYVPGLTRVSAAKEFAQRARPGHISRPVETLQAWYVFQLTERRPAREASLSDVESRVRLAYLQEARREAARARAEEILAKCREGMSLQAAAATDTLANYDTAEEVTRVGFVRGIGQEPRVTGSAFALPAPGLVPRVITGNQHAFVVELVEIHEPSEEEFAEQRAQLRQQILREKQNRALQEWMATQRELAEIDDYRQILVST